MEAIVYGVASSHPYRCKRLPREMAAPNQAPDSTMRLASAWDEAGNSLSAPRLLPACFLAASKLPPTYVEATITLP